MNPLPLVWAQWREARATLSAMALLIALGCAISLGVSAVERAVRQASARAADRFDLIVGAAGSETQLVLTTVYLQAAALKLMPASVLPRLLADPGVVAAVPVATGDSVQGYPMVGTSVEFAGNQGQLALLQGRWFADTAQAVVGSAVTLPVGSHFTPLHGSAADNALEAHAHTGSAIEVVGRLSATGTPWDRAVIVPYATLLQLHAEHGTVAGPPAIVVKPRSVMDAYRLRNAYRSDSTTAVFPAETLATLYRSLGDARELALWIAHAGQVLLVASVLLGLYATLTARAHSLAGLRALGAGRGFIALSLWLQALGVLLAGVLLGTALGWVGAELAAGLVAQRLGLALQVRLVASDLWVLVVIVLAAALAAALVAWRIDRTVLSTALRA